MLNDVIRTPEEKTKWFFSALALLPISWEEKTTIATSIIKDVETGLEYRSQMILSIIIATLWLLINATPVVIGAMLIAPILRPIQALSFGIITGNRKLFGKWLILTISSILFSILTAICITFLVPLSELTNEILMRTQPTIIDLGIAFASWCIAFLAFRYKNISIWIAWVAMAASLVPPLAVVWIGIGMLQWSVAVSSGILFLTNLIAIILAWVLLFLFYWFWPNQKKELKTTIITSWFSLLMIVWLTVPLVSSLFSIIQSINQRQVINTTIQSYIQTIDPSMSLESFQFLDRSLSVKLRAPQSIPFTLNQKNTLTQKLADVLQQDVDVDISIIQFIRAESFATTTSIQPLEKINETIERFLALLYPPVLLVDSKLIESHQTVLVAEFYTTVAFDPDRFHDNLNELLIESWYNLDALLINWYIHLPEKEE